MATKALPTTRKVEIIREKKFAATALDANNKTFVINIGDLAELMIMLIYSFCKAQVALLTSTKIPTTYSNFSNIFSSDSAMELPEYTRINNHLINLLEDKQPPYELIYNLKRMELETLKTYIKAKLANCFISSFKSLISAPILFI